VSLGLVLSLFPGADLLGDAFAEVGFTVVRGPDLLFGSDVRDFHVPPHRFDGVIGGPPCQVHSTAAVKGTDAVDLIPEFLRIVDEAQPRWAVMENVIGAADAPSAPDWPCVLLRDFNCGGHTSRPRFFWFYGIEAAPRPTVKPGTPQHSVLATSWNSSRPANTDGYQRTKQRLLDGREAGRLQGFEEKGAALEQHFVDRVHTSKLAARQLAVHMLGNGVPRAMGLYVARHVKAQIEGRDSHFLTGLPLFSEAQS
jgi:DNA (cytosine-5)-methyltransferase 1